MKHIDRSVGVKRWWGCRTRKRWRHYKRQLRLRNINVDYYPSVTNKLKSLFIAELVLIGTPPTDWTIPIIYKRSI